jgi:1-deoxy-D-xylulose-5-phosphate synthase
MVLPSLEAAETLSREGIDVTVVNCRFLKPLDEACLARLFPAHSHLLTVEEGTVVNGFGAYVRSAIGDRWSGVSGSSLGLPDRFITHGERSDLLADVGLTPAAIAARVRTQLGVATPRPLRETA